MRRCASDTKRCRETRRRLPYGRPLYGDRLFDARRFAIYGHEPKGHEEMREDISFVIYSPRVRISLREDLCVYSPQHEEKIYFLRYTDTRRRARASLRLSVRASGLPPGPARRQTVLVRGLGVCGRGGAGAGGGAHAVAAGTAAGVGRLGHARRERAGDATQAGDVRQGVLSTNLVGAAASC